MPHGMGTAETVDDIDAADMFTYLKNLAEDVLIAKDMMTEPIFDFRSTVCV